MQSVASWPIHGEGQEKTEGTASVQLHPFFNGRDQWGPGPRASPNRT